MTRSLPTGADVSRNGAKKRLSADERRAQILEVAGTVFAEEGFAGAKIRQIAKACGVTEALLYKFFPSKEVLFQETLGAKVAAADVQSFLDTLPNDLTLEEVFGRVARRILEVGIGDEILHRLLLAASLSGVPETRSLYVTWRLPYIEFLSRIVAEGVERGELRSVDPVLTARAFVGLVMDCVISCQLWNDAGEAVREPDALIRNNVPTFVRGLL
ncbi:MAG: TetR/AcrR family transcriptional regulator [Candidatus Eisenbacteria bacterium]